MGVAAAVTLLAVTHTGRASVVAVARSLSLSLAPSISGCDICLNLDAISNAHIFALFLCFFFSADYKFLPQFILDAACDQPRQTTVRECVCVCVGIHTSE